MWKRKKGQRCGRDAPKKSAQEFFALLSLLLMVVLSGGCKKSTPADESSRPTQAQPSPLSPLPSSVSRIHWLGKKGLAAETNAAGFMKIWNMPESTRLEKQTLDKLA